MTTRQFDGIIPSPPDPLDWPLPNFIPLGVDINAPTEMDWEFPRPNPLDQGDTQYCGGFGMAHFGINLPRFRDYNEADAIRFYRLCKEIEGDPLGENGVYARSTAKVLQNLGIIENYAFAPDFESMRWWILNRGPVMIGAMWMDGMMTPDANNVIHATGNWRGGHFFIANATRPDRHCKILNSWGPGWGDNGMAWISEDDINKLLGIYCEIITAVDLEDAIIPPEEPQTPPEGPPVIEPPIIVDPPIEDTPDEPEIEPAPATGCMFALSKYLLTRHKK